MATIKYQYYSVLHCERFLSRNKIRTNIIPKRWGRYGDYQYGF